MFTGRSIVFLLLLLAPITLCWGWRALDSTAGAVEVHGEKSAGFRDRVPGTGQLMTEGVVRFVSDGDTIILESGEKVRYAGIDAPEIRHRAEPSECYGQKARKANSKMVLGKKIILRSAGLTHDRYGRLLAWVYLRDGTCVNVELVRSGSAWVYKMDGNAGSEILPALLKAQREAIGERRGLWGACSVKAAPSYFGNRNTYVFHRPGCPLGREILPRHKLRFADRLGAFSEGFSPCRVCLP